jgi:uncharacterized damage-inducible protein DinB
MLIRILQTLLLRELAAVRRSVEAYPDDASIWVQPAGLPNAAGTLVLHLAGNLRSYIGTVLGGGSYQRDRPAEFSRRDVPRAELLAELDATAGEIARTMPMLTDAMLSQPYPQQIGGHVLRTDVFLTHIATHLAYHLGQIDYHRRVVTGDSTGIGAMAVGELT